MSWAICAEKQHHLNGVHWRNQRRRGCSCPKTQRCIAFTGWVQRLLLLGHQTHEKTFLRMQACACWSVRIQPLVYLRWALVDRCQSISWAWSSNVIGVFVMRYHQYQWFLWKTSHWCFDNKTRFWFHHWVQNARTRYWFWIHVSVSVIERRAFLDDLIRNRARAIKRMNLPRDLHPKELDWSFNEWSWRTRGEEIAYKQVNRHWYQRRTEISWVEW